LPEGDAAGKRSDIVLSLRATRPGNAQILFFENPIGASLFKWVVSARLATGRKWWELVLLG
jgi:hypothetical protein